MKLLRFSAAQEDPHPIGLRAEFELGNLSPELLLALVQSRTPDHLGETRLVLARRALNAGELSRAAEFLEQSSEHAGLWIELFTRLCRDDLDDVKTQIAVRALRVGIAALAIDPGNVSLRRSVSKLFEEPNTGQVAEAWAVEQFAAITPRCPLSITEMPSCPEPEEVMDLCLKVIKGRAHRVLRLLPAERIPKGDLPLDPARFYWGVYRILSTDFEALFAGGKNIEVVSMVLKLGIDLTLEFECDSAYYALDLVHVVATRFAHHQRFQLARNMAEELLIIAVEHEAPALRRLAWFDYADVYLRCNNPKEALMAVGCALMVSGELHRTQDQLFVLELLIRVLRGLAHIDLAIDLIQRFIVTAQDPGARNRARHLLLSVAMSVRPVDDRAALVMLLTESTELLQDALKRETEVAPSLSLHVQLCRSLRQLGGGLPNGATELVDEALDKLAPEQRERMQHLAGDGVDLETLVGEALGLLEQTAYVEDLAWDRRELNFLAGRTLASVADAGNAEASFLVIELLADLSFRTTRRTDRELLQDRIAEGHHKLIREGQRPSRRAVEKIGAPIGRTKSPATMLFRDLPRLSSVILSWLAENIEVHALASDDLGRVIHARATSREGQAVEVLDEADFSMAKLRAWSEDYPHGFVTHNSGPQLSLLETRTLMTQLGVTHRPADTRTLSVFATSIGLTRVPLNLLLRDGEFAGALGPVARVPSLAWLLKTRSAAPTEAVGARLWLLPSAEAEEDDAIDLIRARLPETLSGTGVELSEGSLETISASGLGIVVAHGDLGPDNPQILRLRDNLDQSYSAEDLAIALAETQVVILLVCSGGRVDPASLAATTTGLPRMLLDRGVRAVVASPWLLDVDLALPWLGMFLRLYNGQLPLAAAVHKANLASRDRFETPTYWLAMHVFGDPAVRR